jgi:multicomponent Na+:H+ antiporter subunit E
MLSTLLVFVACLGFWLILSGHFGALEIGLGIVSAAAVAVTNRDLAVLGALLKVTPRFLAYVPWLMKEIVLANWQVMKIVLDPRLPIDPVVGRFQAALSSDLALTTLGNSITLTPGTITLEVDGREFIVHSLTGREAIAGCEGPMASRVARVFRDETA